MPASAHHETPTPHPVSLIRAAVLWCRASGIPVRLGDWGVHCVSSHARDRWERDPRASGVSVLGAALLNYQPEATELRAAAAECLFAPGAWIDAFESGLSHEEMPQAWATALDKRLRAAGYEAGCRYREEFIRIRPARAV